MTIDLPAPRQKDLEGPVRIFQLGSERLPPLRTISNTNLARPASSFVGREKDVEEVISLLRNGPRLLTLTGPGAQARLGWPSKRQRSSCPTSETVVFWVGLASLTDPGLVTETITQTLGAKDGLAALEECLLRGQDEIARTLGYETAIADHEDRRRRDMPRLARQAG